MSKHETFISNSISTAQVSGIALGQHLGVSRNRVPAIVARFGLIRVDNGFRKLDVFRKIHDIEPMLLASTLLALRSAHSCTIAADNGDPKAEPKTLCLIDELSGITDLAETLWNQGLVHIADLAAEYGYAYDPFRKKLKAGSINLPPVRPIELSNNRVMYRPLEIALWHRYGIALDLPRPAVIPHGQDAPCNPDAGTFPPMTEATPEAMTEAVFATAIAEVDKKSGFRALSAPSADAMHKARF